MKASHLIFDLDGTLIDSSAGVIEAVNYAFRQLGETPPGEAAIRASIGYPLEQFFEQASNLPVQELYQHFQHRAANSVVDSAHPLDGVDETLRELRRRGYRMAIATTKIRIHIDRILEKLRWSELFSASVGGNEVRRVKPHPDAFVTALTRLGAIHSEAIAIGDTENDVLAAKAVPLRIVAVTSPYGGNDRVAALHPDHVIARLPELLQILSNGSST